MKNPSPFGIDAQFLPTPMPTPPVPKPFSAWKPLTTPTPAPTPTPEPTPDVELMSPVERRLLEIKEKVRTGQPLSIEDEIILKRMLEK